MTSLIDTTSANMEINFPMIPLDQIHFNFNWVIAITVVGAISMYLGWVLCLQKDKDFLDTPMEFIAIAWAMILLVTFLTTICLKWLYNL